MASGVPSKKLVRSKSGLRFICQENARSPFELSEPPWLPDNQCLQCMRCHLRFDFVKRRHHCRRCGRIFCKTCCEEKMSLPRMCFVDPVRLCASCVETTRKENDFYDRSIKTLISGANFTLSGNQISGEAESNTILCKLSSDHRCITFDGIPENVCQETIRISDIQNVRVIRSNDDFEDNAPASGLHIHYDGSNDELCEVTLTVCSSSNKVQALAWIAALLKAVKMMFESRGPCEL